MIDRLQDWAAKFILRAVEKLLLNKHEQKKKSQGNVTNVDKKRQDDDVDRWMLRAYLRNFCRSLQRNVHCWVVVCGDSDCGVR